MAGGIPKLLGAHGEEWGKSALVWPYAWSPDGRYLLGNATLFEGLYFIVCAVAEAECRGLSGTYSYMGSMSDLTWLRDSSGLLHVRTRGGSSEPLVSLIDVHDPSTETSLLPPWPRYLLAGGLSRPHVSGVDDLDDGTIAIGLQSEVAVAGSRNSIVRVSREGDIIEQLAPLPPVVPDAPGGFNTYGTVWVSPQGGQYVFRARRSDSPDDVFVVGLVNPSRTWDASSILQGASDFVFETSGTE
jgi:hypothetical protein